ncbi:MAG: hypothetical protein QM715_18650 [Nibricoccus sp.]
MKLLVVNNNLSFGYKIEFLRKGKVIAKTPFRRHMLTDSFLNNCAAFPFLDCLGMPVLGESVSPTPVRRDSGSITFTQAANRITASSGFFQIGDVGRLFKWGVGSGGLEVYITNFVSSTQVDVTASPDVAVAAVGTVWYVNTDALLNPIAGLTWGCLNNASENNTTYNTVGNVCIITHNRVFYSSPFTVAKTISEIGFTHPTAFVSLSDRDVVTPGVALGVGDQAKVTTQFIMNVTPCTSQAIANFATGFDSSGNAKFEAFNNDCFRTINAGGGIQGTANMEPDQPPTIGVMLEDFTLQAFDPNGNVIAGTNFLKAASQIAYGAGSYYRDAKAVYAISEGNGTIYGFYLSPWYNRRQYTLKLTTPVVKNSTQVLEITARKSWSRVLTN